MTDLKDALILDAKLPTPRAFDPEVNHLDLLSRRRELVEAIGHDVRTPLAVISSSAELIALTAVSDNEALDKAKTVLVESSRRLGRVASNAIDSERFRIGAAVLEIESIDAADLIEIVSNSLNKRFRAIRINAQISDEIESLQLHCDSERIAHAFSCCLAFFDRLVKTDIEIRLFLGLDTPAGMVTENLIELGFEIEADEALCELLVEAINSSSLNTESESYAELSVHARRLVASALELGIVSSVATLHGGHMRVLLSRPGFIRVVMTLPADGSECRDNTEDSEGRNSDCSLGLPDVSSDPSQNLVLLKDYAAETLCQIIESAELLSQDDLVAGVAKPAKKLIRIKSNAESLLKMLGQFLD